MNWFRRPNAVAFNALATVVVIGALSLFNPGPETSVILGGLVTMSLSIHAFAGRTLISAPPAPTVTIPASNLERMFGIKQPDEPVVHPVNCDALVIALMSVIVIGVLGWRYYTIAPELVGGAGGIVLTWFSYALRDLLLRPPEQMVEIPADTLDRLQDESAARQAA